MHSRRVDLAVPHMQAGCSFNKLIGYDVCIQYVRVPLFGPGLNLKWYYGAQNQSWPGTLIQVRFIHGRGCEARAGFVTGRNSSFSYPLRGLCITSALAPFSGVHPATRCRPSWVLTQKTCRASVEGLCTAKRM